MASQLLEDLRSQGWHRLPSTPALLDWSEQLLAPAMDCMQQPQHQPWWRYQDTWFAGVNVLENDPKGAVDTGPSLPVYLLKQLAEYCQTDQHEIADLDQGQISAVFPGYPKSDSSESAAAHRFRAQHFAAHLDGLIPEGSPKRRYLREQHSYILGISLTDHDPEAAPLMVWPRSHQRIQAWLTDTLMKLPVQQWQQIDLTHAYQQLRQQILADTQAVALPIAKGEAYVLHRHLIHGMGHWPEAIADAAGQGRIVAYFRPSWHSPINWLTGP